MSNLAPRRPYLTQNQEVKSIFTACLRALKSDQLETLTSDEVEALNTGNVGARRRALWNLQMAELESTRQQALLSPYTHGLNTDQQYALCTEATAKMDKAARYELIGALKVLDKMADGFEVLEEQRNKALDEYDALLEYLHPSVADRIREPFNGQHANELQAALRTLNHLVRETERDAHSGVRNVQPTSNRSKGKGRKKRHLRVG
ncbi:MAG: hypothetical protein JWS12_459 [Candidatus Saccharibacteria bacterium]|nr:hypothetical protein [Candidatus Saccharibacteria bacterium]